MPQGNFYNLSFHLSVLEISMLLLDALQYSVGLINSYKANQSCVYVIFYHRHWVPLIIKSKHIIISLPLGNLGHKIWHLILENISNMFFFLIKILQLRWNWYCPNKKAIWTKWQVFNVTCLLVYKIQKEIFQIVFLNVVHALIVFNSIFSGWQ